MLEREEKMRTVAAMMRPTCGRECEHMIADAGKVAVADADSLARS